MLTPKPWTLMQDWSATEFGRQGGLLSRRRLWRVYE